MTGNDTQWPRFQVFHQDRPERPHLNSGSVHAADAEMALLNARDVFVRRPDCVSLWVSRADDITSATAEELEHGTLPEPVEGPTQAYEVFQKKSQIGTHAHAGSVEASSPEDALRRAIEQFGREGVLVWWIIPVSAIVRTDPDEIDSFFTPAASRLFRDQAFYHTITLMRRLREEKEASE